jgi:hypothetical protein
MCDQHGVHVCLALTISISLVTTNHRTVGQREQNKLFSEHAESLQQNYGPMFLAILSRDIRVNSQDRIRSDRGQFMRRGDFPINVTTAHDKLSKHQRSILNF